MAKADVLDRVAVDLAKGHTQPAIQRLSSLVAAHPTDLDLRRRLAAVHRLVGNRIEAGRWTYLEADADQAEVGAFERAYPLPATRLRALRWPVEPRLAATAYARQRLDDLTVLAETERHEGPDHEAESHRSSVWPVAVPIMAVVVALVVIGAVTAVQWIF
jgi:hypothetical protein